MPELDETTLGLGDHDDLSDEEREEVFQQRRERLRRRLDETAAELSAENADRLARLADGLERTEVVEVNGVELRVRAWTSASVEDTLDGIAEADSLAEVREDIVEVLVWFIEDPEYGFRRDADEVTRAAQQDNAHVLWQTFADEYGLASLFSIFEEVTAPAVDRFREAGDAASFR